MPIPSGVLNEDIYSFLVLTFAVYHPPPPAIQFQNGNEDEGSMPTAACHTLTKQRVRHFVFIVNNTCVLYT